MKKKLPSITVIIPTYNEKKTIGRCLKSIRGQDYPQRKVKILIVDDYSTDETLKIAKDFGVKIIYNGAHDCQVGRVLGLKKAKGELVLILDADNALVSTKWLRKSVQPFLENSDLVGSQPAWYQYSHQDRIVNRWCALFGVTQPIPFYLKKRSFMMTTEKKWIYPQTLIGEKKDYFLTRFKLDNLPTMGCQGFLVKRKLVLKTHYQPMFFHMDMVYELVEKGNDLFAIIKLPISHQYVDSLGDYYQKIIRYTTNFLRFRKKRKYTYQVNFSRHFWTLFLMMTVVVPLFESIKGFFKIKDPAWFLHPLFCFTTPLVSGYAVLKWMTNPLFNDL